MHNNNTKHINSNILKRLCLIFIILYILFNYCRGWITSLTPPCSLAPSLKASWS